MQQTKSIDRLMPESYWEQLAEKFGGTSTTPEPERDRRVAELRRCSGAVCPWGIGITRPEWSTLDQEFDRR